MAAALNRRALLGSLAAIPAAAAVPAIAMSALSPFRLAEARLKAATARFNGLPIKLEVNDLARYEAELNRYIDACRAAELAPVADLREFADQFVLAAEGGMSLPNEETVMKLVADAKRLTAV